MHSWQRVKKLAASVETWVSLPGSQATLGREAGWVCHPHRYARKTRQIAVRTPKKDGTWGYSVLVSTQMEMSLAEIVKKYDQRIPHQLNSS